ncbi:MAG: acyltransferase [Bacteroidetes bacterium]|nr:acyltransferase [Bacteroidota bacterium]
MKMLSHLRRSTNQGVFIPEIDGLRFFAIMTVVLFHLNTTYGRTFPPVGQGLTMMDVSIPELSWYFRRFDLGVKVFFAISGFILSLPFLKHYLLGHKRVDVGDYFLRRLKRLEPPFLISLTLLFFLRMISSMPDLEQPWLSLLAGIFYSHVLAFGISNPINPVTWSLETEAQFYIIVPLLFWVLFMQTKRWMSLMLMLVLMVGSIYFRRFVHLSQLAHLAHSVPVYLSNFLIGTAFAWLFLSYPRFFSSRHLAFDLMGIFSWWLMFRFYKPQFHPEYNAYFNLSIFLFFIAVFKGHLFNTFFTWQPVYTIGGMCYSIYLLHYAFFIVVIPLTAEWTQTLPYHLGLLLQSLLLLPVMLIGASIFYMLIEKPCMDKHWPDKVRAWLNARLSKNNHHAHPAHRG